MRERQRGGLTAWGIACWLTLLALSSCLPLPWAEEDESAFETPTVETSLTTPTVWPSDTSTPSAEPPTEAPTATSSPTAAPTSTASAMIPSATVTAPDQDATATPTTISMATPSAAPPTTPTTPTPTPTNSPQAPTQPPTATEPSPATVAVWEQEITLQTYGWQDALVPTEPGDPIYPYPRLNFEAVTPPEPQSYRAVVIQNRYVRLVVLPELGGRILRWTDRVTGRQLFYANPVIKPTHWGYRGWWLATGGMEWTFPTEEHGLNEYRPWQYQLLWNGVRVWDTEDRTGMTIEVTISLEGGESAFSVKPRIVNPTAQAQQYQFWANAMLTLSETNSPSPGLTFVLPDDQVTVHATADESLPSPGQAMRWPIHNGRDFSQYSTWERYLGVFADPAQAGFFGAYDRQSDQGVVRVFPHEVARGVKIFCLGDLSSSLWTDDGQGSRPGRYVELWAGLTPTFWDNWTLNPGASVSWTEQWYAVSGIGGYNWANETATIRLTPSGDSATVAVSTTRELDGTVVLRRGGADVARWDASIAPDRPFQASGGPASAGDWGVQVLTGGQVVAQMGP
jgi:hypothetical protein